MSPETLPYAKAPRDNLRIPEHSERSAALLAAAYGFCLFAGYYILRALREEMGVAAGGVRQLPWMFTATWVVTLVANPLLAALVGMMPRERFIPIVNRLFIVVLLLFVGGFRIANPAAKVWVSQLFFVWVTVFILFAVSVFWGLMADLFTSEQGKRLFGLIGAGGTAGAICGSAIVTVLATRLGPIGLMLPAAALLELGVQCLRALTARASGRRLRGGSGRSVDAELARGGALGGALRTVQSPYLLAIAALVTLFAITSTFAYFEQARIFKERIPDSGARTAAFARIDLFANLLALLLQSLLTGRVLSWIGVGGALAVLPTISLAGFGALAFWSPSVALLSAFQVLRRAADFAIAKPAREVLFTVVRRDEKYKAKSFVDTLVYRSADVVGGWWYNALPQAESLPKLVLFCAAPIALAWGGLGLMLGRWQSHRAAIQPSGPPAEAAENGKNPESARDLPMPAFIENSHNQR